MAKATYVTMIPEFLRQFKFVFGGNLFLCLYAFKRDKIHRKILLETDINTKMRLGAICKKLTKSWAR